MSKDLCVIRSTNHNNITNFHITRLDWVNNGNGTYSAKEICQHPQDGPEKVLETISEGDYFLLVLEGKDHIRLQELFVEDNEKNE